MTPFFINSNICVSKADVTDLSTFMRSVCGNTGNSYITYALVKEICPTIQKLNHIQNIYTYDFSTQDKDIDFINNCCSHVFFILQDQIRISESYDLKLPYDLIIQFLKRIKKPVIIAGLGANSFDGYDPWLYTKLDSALIYFLKALSDRTREIGVRGNYTQEVLQQIGINNTRVIGCPSFFEMGRNRKKIEKPSLHQNLKIAASLTGIPVSFLKETKAGIFLQDCLPLEKEVIKLIAFKEQGNWSFLLNQIGPILCNHFYIFSNIEEWKKKLSAYDFFVGLRVHGAICALNSGIPALIMNRDSRAREMSEFLGIPWNPELLNNLNINNIYDFCSYDDMNSRYETLYDNFSDFLSRNDVSLFDNKKTETNTLRLFQPSLVLNNLQQYIVRTIFFKHWVKKQLIRFLSHITFGSLKNKLRNIYREKKNGN